MLKERKSEGTLENGKEDLWVEVWEKEEDG